MSESEAKFSWFLGVLVLLLVMLPLMLSLIDSSFVS